MKRCTNLALLVNTIDFCPSRIASLQLDAGTSKTSPQGIGGIPGMVMRDLAVDVVGNMGLRDTMCAGSGDPAHDGSEIPKEAAIVGRQGTTGKSELARTIMGKERVGVLQERDQNKPVINPGKASISLKPWMEKGGIPHTRGKEQDRCGRPRRIQRY